MRLLLLCFLALVSFSAPPTLKKEDVIKFLTEGGTKEWQKEKIFMRTNILIEPNDLIWQVGSDKITVLSHGELDTSYNYKVIAKGDKIFLHLENGKGDARHKELVYQIDKINKNELEISDSAAITHFHSPPRLSVPTK